ncbi:MAG: hypothetical protein RR275_03240 [Lachnospiraceae bacterium]
MLIAKNNEELRSKLWRIVTTVTSALIIIITIFVLTKLFTDNPLDGTWIQKDDNLQISIKGNGVMYVEWNKLYEEDNVKIEMEYVLDKEAKTIAFKMNPEKIKETVQNSKGQLTEEGLRADVGVLETTYDYSVDKKTLTLTEREYGEQLSFEKK